MHKEKEILEISGTDFMIDETDVCPELWEDLKACHHSGDCEGTVKAFLDKWQVKVSAEDCKAYLKPLGAWNEEELRDHSVNIERLVWVLAGNIYDSENGEGYLSQY